MGIEHVERFRRERFAEIDHLQRQARKDDRREVVIQVVLRWMHMVFESLPDLGPRFDEAARRRLAEQVADLILAGG